VSTDFTSMQNCLFSLSVSSLCLSTWNISTLVNAFWEVLCEISQEDYILLHIVYGELASIFLRPCAWNRILNKLRNINCIH
jgi:hypothetical protein